MSRFLSHSTVISRLAWAVLVCVLLVRIALVLFMGITPQDAYYHMYARSPDWSYFDHPPMVAYMLMPLRFLLGDSVFAIKASDFIVTAATLVLIYHLAKNFYAGVQAFMLTCALGVSLMFTLCATNTTPDIPLLFFWTFSMLLAYKALTGGGHLLWALTGLAMAFAFDSKYTGLMLPAGFVLFLILSQPHRKFLFSSRMLCFILFFLIGVFPVFWWNYQHGWPSFLFQTVDRVKQLNGPILKPQLFLGTLLTQIAILSPFLLYAIWRFGFQKIWAFLKHRLSPDQDELFLLAFSLPILFFFTGVSFFSWVKINWMYPAYIGGTILIFRVLPEYFLKGHFWFSGIVNLLMALEIFGYVVPVRSDDTWVGWEELSHKVDQISDSTDADFIFSMDSYKTSAVLGFYLKSKPIYAANVLNKNALQFSILNSAVCLENGKNALFIDSEPDLRKKYHTEKTDSTLSRWFEEVTSQEPVMVYSPSGTLLRRFQVFWCQTYHCSGIPKE